MSPSALVQDVCATCTQTFTDEDLTDTKQILPTIFYLVVLFCARYKGAILNPLGMRVHRYVADLRSCTSCQTPLTAKKPYRSKNAIANIQ